MSRNAHPPIRLPGLSRPRSFSLAWPVLALWLARTVQAELMPALLFQDNMVLQQGAPVPVWGKAVPGEEVAVEFAGQKKGAKADPDGAWKVTLDALKASGSPQRLTISGSLGGRKLALSNVLVGEVWLCSGQSNMEWRVKDSANAGQEIADAAPAAIRMVTAGHNRWSVCSPETVGDFSAVGYFFARELHQRLGVPVGMLNSSAGGTMIQPWMTPESARGIPSLKAYWADLDDQVRQSRSDPKAWQQRYKDAVTQTEKAQAEWEQRALANDPGLKERWFAPDTRTASWPTIELPMPDADGGLNDVGTVWLRLDTWIPKSWVGKALILQLGPIDEIDFTYFNGKLVGSTWRDVPDFWRIPRRYTVPAEANTSARVTLAVRMYNLIGLMGLFGKPEQMALRLAEDPQVAPVSLATTWRIRRGAEMDFGTRPGVTLLPNPGPDGDFGGLYRAKIAPMVPYAIRGVLWYQGESNAHEPERYAELFPALIYGWRQAWGQGDFPFYFVQLAGHQGRQRLPVERCSWAEIREAQSRGLALPNTGMVVATDIGDAADIHPRNKQEVGRRLALWALAKDYGVKLEYSGPRYAGMSVRGAEIVLKFDHARGLRLEGDPQAGFAIAGEDKVFHAATAVVRGKTVVVTAADGGVPKPVGVRYGWAFHPSCFLYNSANLPASPFRTDDWPAGEVRASFGAAARPIHRASPRIVNLGDSITDGQTYALLVEQALREAGKPVPTFIGAGIGGDTASGMRKRLDRDVLVHRPDMVMLCSGINDVGLGRKMDAYEADVAAIAERLQAENVKLMLLTTSNLRGGARSRELEDVRAVLHSVAETFDLPVAEVYDRMEESRKAGLDLWEKDGAHLNLEGYRSMARAVLDALGHKDVPVPKTQRCEMLPGIIRRWKVLTLPDDAPPLDEKGAAALVPDKRWRDYRLPQEQKAENWWLDQERQRGFAVSLNEMFGGKRHLALAEVRRRAGRAWINTGGELGAVWLNGTKLPVDPNRGWHAGGNRIPVDFRSGTNTIIIETGGRFFLSITESNEW